MNLYTIIVAALVAVAAIGGMLFLYRKLDRAEAIAAQEMVARWNDAKAREEASGMFVDLENEVELFDPETGMVLDDARADCPTYAVLPPGYTMVDMKGFVPVSRDPKTGRFVKKAA